jgi:hypothetical protein
MRPLAMVASPIRSLSLAYMTMALWPFALRAQRGAAPLAGPARPRAPGTRRMLPRQSGFARAQAKENRDSTLTAW